jgi:4'-phosphopantetheinyl transferase EntD
MHRAVDVTAFPTDTVARELACLLPPGVALALECSDDDTLEAQAVRAGIGPCAEARHPRRRADFLAGRLAARAALQQLGAPSLAVGRRGTAPVWPAGYCGSISHSAGRAVAIAAAAPPWRALGVDVQTRIGVDRMRALRHALSGDEARACERDADPWAWTRAWAAKEAAYKCVAALGADPALQDLLPAWHDAARGTLVVCIGGETLRIGLASRVAAELIWVVASLAVAADDAARAPQSSPAGLE